MEEVRVAYDAWSAQYDTNENKTRDLEGVALRSLFNGKHFNRILELGCGTGKNTIWLQSITKDLISVDLSEQMLDIAKKKVSSTNVQFHVANLLEPWSFPKGTYDLVVCSLMLEHIEDLKLMFQKISSITEKGAQLYLGELHPFKQYAGSKARFETEQGVQVVTCFTHHISDFVDAAETNGFKLLIFKEFFDQREASQIPRLLCLVFEKL
jgi:ubiquinone/menaquinone biosynthesis C-methylase UbiE